MELLANLRKNKEPLLHCSVFIELKAKNTDALKELQSEIAMELTRSKISVDRLTLRQKEGFLSVLPVGANQFGAQYERVLPASSVANLYPFNFSGKTDPQGVYIGRDKFGSNVLVDFDLRAEDKTTSNILILGNSGQGKSYLLKLILTNIRESGKSVICLDPESEYEEICSNLGGCYIDFLSGKYIINPLEPKSFGAGGEDNDNDMNERELGAGSACPTAFKKVTRLSQHIAFLKDFFRAYKDFSDTQIDTIEILLSKLYARFGITDSTDYSKMKPTDYPIMEDFYNLCEEEFMTYDKQRKYLYTEETLQEVCLGIQSMCVGAENKYFNGQTNITDDAFLVFGVKGLLDTNKRLKDAMLFNILSFMSNQLLGKGNTAASIDELYLFLTNMTAIEYIRNAMKRVRKKDSSIILASQNIEDFLIPSIREFTKPLFSIPTHQFLFNAGQINPKEYMDALQVEPSEFELIKYPERGTCLYRCGNEPSLNDKEKISLMWQHYKKAKILLNRDNENYDPNTAVEFLIESAKLECSVAKYRLGKMFLQGKDVPKNVDYALRWLEESVSEGNEFAEYLLGKTYLKGEDVEQDLIYADDLLRRSSAQGNKYAKYTLGKSLLDGELFLQNIPEAIKLITESADNGFAPAQYLLGKLLYKGEVMPQDLKKAIEYLEKAAGQKNPYAAYLAGKYGLQRMQLKTLEKQSATLKSPLRTEITMQSICSARRISTAKMPRVTMIERLYTLLPQPNMEISMLHSFSTV